MAIKNKLKIGDKVLHCETDADVVLFSDTTVGALLSSWQECGKNILACNDAQEVRSILKIPRDILYDDAGLNWYNRTYCFLNSDYAKFNNALYIPKGHRAQCVQGIFLGGQDFTIDFWAYFHSNCQAFGSPCSLVANIADYTIPPQISFRRDSTNDKLRLTLRFDSSSSINQTGSANIMNVLKHYELDYQHSTGNWTVYVDGTADINLTDTVLERTYFTNLLLGLFSSAVSQDFAGYISEFRISDGIARHTENFTPPDSQYEVDDYTVSLLHFE